MSNDSRPKVRFVEVSAEEEGQRIDNYLVKTLKGVPKSRIYKMVRKGEVRVNKGRIKAEYKIKAGDFIRIPPVQTAQRDQEVPVKLNVVQSLEDAIIYEDERIIVLNKPSGMAVHGGSGMSFGVIEALRALRPTAPFLELVHRLDRDTSGCLMIAKRRSTLRFIHKQLQEKKISKRYWALVTGHWPAKQKFVDAPLRKFQVKSGERLVRVSDDGKPCLTSFKVVERFKELTLVSAEPITGRTHQIRVHAQSVGCSLVGDDKYGDDALNQQFKRDGLCERLFLHAYSLEFKVRPEDKNRIKVEAPLPDDLQHTVNQLRKQT
ncbi:23S rRNA pseudouridine(955/2504/2580) synthase RluC [Kangiella geojedonensis]|uniref:Pseudouridine synthase n=1 Tax=Kangiella geojedonensis TaxID=914150 RepID=A0A0F6RC05_9GAMM|nr:23S rRNA pseudouridine(955/2504/2580) synthase RluC [Kangiella geojedonensis]AKE51998.1 23S rRNA pseudouridylate synthase C [Kangiella geojedonensis]